MATVKKLILVRKKDAKSDMLTDAPFYSLIKNADNPLPLSPSAWPMESGISHYGFIVEGMKLKDLEAMEDYNHNPETIVMNVLDWSETLVEYDRVKRTRKNTKVKDNDSQLLATLANVGLCINELALEESNT